LSESQNFELTALLSPWILRKEAEIHPDQLCGAADMEAFRKVERQFRCSMRRVGREQHTERTADSQGNGRGATFIVVVISASSS
jgi:hypothetical protein